jgi:hypothetical protein
MSGELPLVRLLQYQCNNTSVPRNDLLANQCPATPLQFCGTHKKIYAIAAEQARPSCERPFFTAGA